MAYELSRDRIGHAGRFQQGSGRMAQAVETQFVLFTGSRAAFAGAVMAAFFRQPGGNENFMKLVAQVSGAALALPRCFRARMARCRARAALEI